MYILSDHYHRNTHLRSDNVNLTSELRLLREKLERMTSDLRNAEDRYSDLFVSGESLLFLSDKVASRDENNVMH